MRRRQASHGRMRDLLRSRRTRLAFLVRDVANLVRFGADAPRCAQLIWVDPRTVDSMIEDITGLGRSVTGTVRGGDWDRRVVPFDAHPKVAACAQHFEHGVSWEATGIVAYMRERLRTEVHPDGYRDLDEVLERYRALDRFYEHLRSGGAFMTRRTLKGGRAFREQGGVYVHVDRNTRPVFGLGGYHRLAVARLLGLERIPAQLGVVHTAALRSWRARYDGP
jgi:hypothetical protein